MIRTGSRARFRAFIEDRRALLEVRRGDLSRAVERANLAAANMKSDRLYRVLFRHHLEEIKTIRRDAAAIRRELTLLGENYDAEETG